MSKANYSSSCLSGIGAWAHVVGPDLWESGELLTEDMAAYMLAPMSDDQETAAQYLQTTDLLKLSFVNCNCEQPFKSCSPEYIKSKLDHLFDCRYPGT